ncbi:phage tail length tape measure family protein [Acidovorax sp. LjRoot74]|uniref:phage tail length tape measure family protein n=1 Tax=Acidovorax sp. LjRoot74 TaxID=3342337 RepID=UPI003ECCBE87
MTSDLRIQGEVVVNSEQAESAFNRVGDKAQQMANEVATSAGKAGQAVDKIGDGAGVSAEKFTRAESRISASIKRATNELELLGKTASQRLEFNISDKGLDPKKFEPMLQRLREVEQRAREAEAAATGSLNNMGMSARATAAAMRGVPAQFQDIIVSLQGGQAPMTVLLQQGSQLSGMFGGAGNAARALGTYIVGLVNPLTIAAAAVAGLGFAMYSLNGKDAALRDLSAQLVGTGRASAAAVGDIKALVNELNTVPGVSKAAATAIIGEFAKVSGLGSSLFKGLGSSVADFAAATGTDLPTAAKKLAEAFADPAKGAKALEDTLGTLTAAQILTITKMAEMGDKSGAQAALLDALKQATEGLAKQGMTPLGEATDKMSNAWDKLTTSVGNSSAFRTANDWLAKLIEKTAELTVRLSQMQPPTWLKYMPGIGPAIGAASLLAGPEASSGGSRSVSGKVGTVEGGATGSWGPTSQEMESQVKAALDLTKSYESQSAAMEKLRGVARVAKDALKELEAQNKGNSVEAKELRERITGVNEKLAEMAKKGQGDVKAEQNAYESLIASIRDKIAQNEQEIKYSGRLNEADKLRIKFTEDLAAGKLKLTEAHKAEIRADLDRLDIQERAKVATKLAVSAYQEQVQLADEAAQAYVAEAKAREAGRAAINGYVNGIDEANKALQFELSVMGLSAQARDVALEQYRIELDLKKQIAAIDANSGFNEQQREEERAKARAAAAIATANASSKAFLDEWKQSVSTYDDIFRRGFADMLNNGKDGWKSFTKSLATTFKTTVADQLYKAFAQPFVVNIVGNLLGLTGSLGLSAASGAAAAASGGSALSGLGTLASGASLIAGNFGAGLTTGFSGLMAGNLGSTLGLGTGLIGSGATAGGIGTIVGALGPIALGIGALVAIAKATKGETRTGGQFGVAFDGSVTNQRRGQTYTIEGQQFDRDFTNGLQTALKDGIAYRLEGDPVAQESAIREAVAGTASGINGFLKALGSAATLTGFSAGLETSGKGRGGVFAGGLLSTGQGFGESGKGDNYAGTLYEAFSTNSPDFKTALENFTLDLKQATIQALQTVSDIPQAVQKLLKGVDAEGLTEDAANKLLETINAQIVGVNQFKDALKGMGLDTLAALSFDAAAGLAEVSGGFDKLLGNLQTYYTNFFTGEEQRANLQRSLAQQLSTLGLQLPDINASNARDQFRALVSAAEKDMSEAGRKTYATLLSLSGAFASITEAAATTTQTLEQQRQAYYGALQDAVSARNKSLQNQLSAAQEVASALGDVFDTLRSNVRELYGEVDGTRGMLAAQGNSFIDQALATAKASGYLPDPEKLAEAISAARGGLDGGTYTTQFAADRDRLVLAGKLSGLQEIADKQLTDAQRTVRALETQIDQNEQTLDYWKQQIEIASGTYQGILSVESAIQQLSGFLGGTGSTRPTAATGSLGGDISGPAYRDRGTVARADYGADVALSSFEKFKDWYQGLATNANVGALQSAGYQVPDWMRVGGMAGDSTDKELFGSYLYFKNNPQFAKDFEQVMTTGRSSLPTDGSTLVRSDLSKMPADVAAYFQSDRNSLLSYESFGLDPVLAYKLYKDGPEQFGLNLSRENFTEWLRTHKWTEGGVVSANNTLDTAKGYAGYNLARYDTGTGNIVNLDGSIYSPDGKYLGMAGRDLMASVYGSAFLGTSGGSYGDATRSALYNSQVQGGNSEAAYYGAIKSNLDAAIAGGMSAQGIADAITQTGASMADVAAAYGITVAQLEENLRAGGATNIPKFAVGTNYVPRDMLAYIHEGEAVVPKAYNPAAGGSGSDGNAELVAELRALREAVAALQAAANETAGNTRLMPQMGRQFDQVAGTGRVLTRTT